MSSKQDYIAKNQAKAGKAGLSMRVTLILFALLPLIVSSTDACTDTQASTATMRTVNDDMREAISFFKL